MVDLTKEQQKQIEKQLKEHQHANYKVDIILTKNEILRNFSVHARVLRPEIMNALHLARWLFLHKEIYKNKTVLDMGSGTGIQGIVAALYGAKEVIFSDLSHAAVENTKENIKFFGMGNISEVFEGDLFEKIKNKSEIIIFNHPFFSDKTMEENILTKSAITRGELIHRFFDQAKKFLNKNGVIIMPYFHLAGKINDPAVQALKHGYFIKERFKINSNIGLQKGENSICILKLN